MALLQIGHAYEDEFLNSLDKCVLQKHHSYGKHE